MRALLTLAVIACSLTLGGGCIPDERKTPEWQKPPKAWNPTGDELTLGAKGLEAFNALSYEQRAAQIEQWAASPGSFKGQAMYKSGAGLGESMDDAQYGSYEIFAEVPDPVLYEITVTYRLYSTPDKGKNLPPNGYIEFTGNIVELDYEADTKPRKMEVKVKVDEITVLTD